MKSGKFLYLLHWHLGTGVLMDGGLGAAQGVLSPLWRVPQALLVGGQMEAVPLFWRVGTVLCRRCVQLFPHCPGEWLWLPEGSRCLSFPGQGHSRGDFSWQCP